MKLSDLQKNRTAAYAGPFAVFMLFKAVSDFIKTPKAGAPWWRSDPEHWVYPIQTLLCLALLWWWRSHYKLDLSASNTGEMGEKRSSLGASIAWGVIAGVIGLILWLLPGWIYLKYGELDLPTWVNKALGIVSRHGKGFNPDVFPADTAAYAFSLTMRFIRMALAVAILEELFWRGFLWRQLDSEHSPAWWKIPFAQAWSRGFWVTLLVWPVAHSISDYLGCIIYAAIIGYVAIRTRRLLACIICHGITNLGLGIYVLKTGLWNYW